MSKHWNPRVYQGGKARRVPGRLPREWDAYRAPGRGLSGREWGLMLGGGLLLGLGVAFASTVPSWWEEPQAAAPAELGPAPDYYAESKRSLEILREQEGPPPEAEDRTPGNRSAISVAHPSGVAVIDGDTFRLNGVKIRIADIDTPEVNGRCASETALAAEATQRMGELLAQGPFQLHPVERDEDRYGRKLRVVTRGGRSLGDQLVSEGLARTWTARREPWCA